MRRSVALSRFTWSRAAQTTRRGFYYQPAGLGEDFPAADRTGARLDRDFAAIAGTGSKLLRVGIPWGDVQTAPGKYDWAFWDRLVTAADQRNITLIPYVCYTPEWAGRTPDDFWRRPPRDIAAFGQFMFTIASRYRGKVRAWELWNEPDNADFWLGTPGEYAELVRQGAAGVRRADLDDVVVLGGLAGDYDRFFATLESQYHIEDVVDVVNMHNYAGTWNRDTIEDYPYRINRLATAISRPGGAPDLWLAEFGYSSIRDAGPSQSGYMHSVYDYEHTDGYQAATLFKAHIEALSTAKLSLTAWYRINDLAPTQAVIGDENNRYFGILDVQGRPKPAYYALKLYNTLFDAPARAADSAVAVESPAASQSVVHAFEKQNGDLIITAWLRSSRSGEAADSSGSAVDRRHETLTLRVPGKSWLRAYAFDVTGGRRSVPLPWPSGALHRVLLAGSTVVVIQLSGVSPENRAKRPALRA